ncbi:unnamed protein product, partial [Cyprideis torosa]
MSSGRVLVYGGGGALGSCCVRFFKEKNFWVGSVDMRPTDEADANVVVDPSMSWTDQSAFVAKEVGSVLGQEKLDSVFCVAGGWAGGNASSDDFIKNADLMWKQSVWTSGIASRVGSKFLKEGGLLVLTGAQPAFEGTPGMLGYGMAKAAVHQLTKGLAKPKGGLPSAACVLAICPVTLDTPMNRKFMPNADHSTWTPLEFIAETFFD